MFQYAFGRYISTLLRTSLFLDKGSYLSGSTNRLFDLDIFPLFSKVKIGDLNDISLSEFQEYILISEKGYKYDEKLAEKLILQDSKMNEAIILDGYWQSYKYFLPINTIISSDFFIRPHFNEKFARLLQKINSTNSVMVNVRRGDYLEKINYHGVVETDYLLEAMNLLASKIVSPFFYIFSDDIPWCINNIRGKENIFFVDEKYYDSKFKSYFILMKSCKHFIIANSTFCWWAAWLASNPYKIVIAPKKWFAIEHLSSEDLIPEEWIRL